MFFKILCQISRSNGTKYRQFDKNWAFPACNYMYKSHTDKVTPKLSKYSGIINKLKNYLPLHTLKALYNSLVQPQLNYAVIVWGYKCYPALAREFQGFRVWGKFVFRTLELTDTPTNLANQVKVGHALDQSRSVQSRGPEKAHQNNEPSWRSSRTDRRLSRQFWDD